MRRIVVYLLVAYSCGWLANYTMAQVDPSASKQISSEVRVDWFVTTDQGAELVSPNFKLNATTGQSVAGTRSEGQCLMIGTGFWQNFPGWCCRNRRGNVDDDVRDMVDLSDLSLLINYLVKSRCETHLFCKDEANVQPAFVGDIDPIDISDLSTLIGYLVSPGGTVQLPLCP